MKAWIAHAVDWLSEARPSTRREPAVLALEPPEVGEPARNLLPSLPRCAERLDSCGRVVRVGCAPLHTTTSRRRDAAGGGGSERSPSEPFDPPRATRARSRSSSSRGGRCVRRLAESACRASRRDRRRGRERRAPSARRRTHPPPASSRGSDSAPEGDLPAATSPSTAQAVSSGAERPPGSANPPSGCWREAR